MDTLTTTERREALEAKAKAGTITENEFVEMLFLINGRDAETARDIFHTSYAASLDPNYGKTYVS